jgi:hypothetical protein
MKDFLKYAIREKYRQMKNANGKELFQLRFDTAIMWRRLRREHRSGLLRAKV